MLSNIVSSTFFPISIPSKPNLATPARTRVSPMALAALACAPFTVQADEQRGNHFGDPFIVITKGLINKLMVGTQDKPSYRTR